MMLSEALCPGQRQSPISQLPSGEAKDTKSKDQAAGEQRNSNGYGQL